MAKPKFKRGDIVNAGVHKFVVLGLEKDRYDCKTYWYNLYELVLRPAPTPEDQLTLYMTREQSEVEFNG